MTVVQKLKFRFQFPTNFFFSSHLTIKFSLGEILSHTKRLPLRLIRRPWCWSGCYWNFSHLSPMKIYPIKFHQDEILSTARFKDGLVHKNPQYNFRRQKFQFRSIPLNFHLIKISPPSAPMASNGPPERYKPRPGVLSTKFPSDKILSSNNSKDDLVYSNSRMKFYPAATTMYVWPIKFPADKN